jgi:hypothetical protein
MYNATMPEWIGHMFGFDGSLKACIRHILAAGKLRETDNVYAHHTPLPHLFEKIPTEE